MRKFTKCLMTLGLLLVAGVASAKETVVFSMDYSTQSTYPFWGAAPDGSSFELADGMLVIKNTKKQTYAWDLQIDLAEGFRAAAGLDYKVNIVYKTTADGDINLGMGTLTGDIQYEDRVNWYGAPVKAKDEFQTFEWSFTYTNTNAANHVIWQCGNLIATVYIKSIEVIEITPDAPQAGITYGDNLVEFANPVIYVKHGGGDVIVSEPDASGVHVARSITTTGDEWTTQFWIGVGPDGPALPAGKKFKIQFDYKADNAAEASTQTHRGTALTENAYIIWHCIGNVNFGEEWDTFETTQEISEDMAGWQAVAFNLNVDKTANNYYFKNIKIWVPEVTGETVGYSVGSIGWASFSSNKNVDLGTAKGYAAKFNGSYVELAPVTEVPAGDAILIEGAGKYVFDVIPSAAAIADNDLKVSDGNVTGDGIYVLANGKNGVGFYKLASGQKVPAGKAYLQIPASAREFIGFGDATSIETVKTAKAEEGIFNLQGQRLMKAQKGLNIINGKKFLVK